MDEQSKQAWSAPYRTAVEDLILERCDFSYVTADGINLEKVADLGPWEPSDIIRELVQNFDLIEVELISMESDLNLIHRKLLEQKTIGLVVMGSVIHRKSKPSLIVMITDDRLYAIDPSDVNRGIKFLSKHLRDQRLEFWLTNGKNEADCLYHNYDINLKDSNASCCTGVHIHMMNSMASKPNAGLMVYPPQTLFKCRRKPRIEKFETLVELWLDVYSCEFNFDINQLPHLSTRPLSVTAINLIKKRCTLVLPLARALKRYSWLEVEQMSLGSYRMLTNLSNNKKNARRDSARDIKKKRDSGEADYGFFIHLNGC